MGVGMVSDIWEDDWGNMWLRFSPLVLIMNLLGEMGYVLNRLLDHRRRGTKMHKRKPLKSCDRLVIASVTGLSIAEVVDVQTNDTMERYSILEDGFTEGQLRSLRTWQKWCNNGATVVQVWNL